MLNGNLKSLLPLWKNLACNRRYQPFVSKTDIKVFERRVGNEGLHFLTVALPDLGRALDTFHCTNLWKTPESYKTDSDGMPLFLGAAVKSAIAGNSTAVDCVRQLTYIFYKLEAPHEDATIDQALEQFIETDKVLGDIDFNSRAFIPEREIASGLPAVSAIRIINEMRKLVARVLVNSDPRDIFPRHGGGSTADRAPNHMKYHTFRYYEKLDRTYDYSSHFFLSPTHLVDEMDKLESAIPMEPCARVCIVPKDSRGPRIISCEPHELMYVQQGLMRKLYDTIECHPLTKGQVNFSDQGINKSLACMASINDSLATIDLKDASDRVSLELVRQVFPDDWYECLTSCRSEETILPRGKGKVKLNKFAPMGSSCCFPVEALIFWSCAQAVIRLTRDIDFRVRVEEDVPRFARILQRPRSERTLRPVYVYGDDILCDTAFAGDIMEGLETIGLLVNRSKSYVSGPFRESCGGDYHNGYDVTPVRVRKEITNVGTRLQTSADLANEFIAKFGYEDSHQLIRVIEESVGYLFPRTLLDVPTSIRATPSASNDVVFRRRYRSRFQRFEHRVLSLHHSVKLWHEPGWFELLRKQLSGNIDSSRYPYENELNVLDRKLRPGEYADPHSAHWKWEWTWLG
jgi:hypothetical protein